MDIAALEAYVETDTFMLYVKIQHARHVNNVIPDCVYIIKNSSSVDSGHCAYLSMIFIKAQLQNVMLL